MTEGLRKRRYKMKLNIYQINLDRDLKRVAFLPYERMRKYSDFESSIYDKVYSGDIDHIRAEPSNRERKFIRFRKEL